ncbi:MAG: DUF488 domain-containing protein [Isosphaeraceae bacterium]|nr:DUF488 domain-containing protein [Isosphaeraceae bacterium]
MTPALWLVGYGAWPAPKRMERLKACLVESEIVRLVDVRIGPCASDLEPGRPYGPKAWNLQEPGQGIARELESAGIAYEWLVELGNPQRQDPEMRILRAHLADPSESWPVHRGLARLEAIVRGTDGRVAILCACDDGSRCHRTVVARALAERRFGGRLELHELSPPPRSRSGQSAKA